MTATPRRWFGLRGTASEAEPAHTPGSAPALDPATALEQGRRRTLLDRIGAFLLDNGLEVSPRNLLLAHAAFSGADSRLERRIALRLAENGAITQEWLDERAAEADGEDGEVRKAELDKLSARLQSGIEGFTATARAARGTAGDYQAELERQAVAIAGFGSTGAATARPDAAEHLLSNLADIANAMLERTRQVEEQMRRSEDEASNLRRRLAQAQRDAEIDHLTGLPNRRAFEGVYNRHYREAQAEIEPLCVAFCDIDHFKAVNDSFGHDTGDRVIQSVGQLLARISDDKCHVARHGGEEFVMLFRGMGLAQAHAKLDSAREQMASRNFVNRKTDEPIGNITFSGGIANVFAYADPRAALEAADTALYRAKAEGRNRIVLAGG